MPLNYSFVFILFQICNLNVGAKLKLMCPSEHIAILIISKR